MAPELLSKYRNGSGVMFRVWRVLYYNFQKREIGSRIRN